MSLPVFLSLLRLSLIKYLVCQNPRLLVPGSPCTVTVAKREILFLDSLRPDGFGDETYRTIFRLRLKIINLLALFQACYLVTISKRSLVLRLQVHIRALFSGFKFIFESHS